VGKTRILVVENEVIVAEDIKIKLERFGYDVPATASSGEEAVKLAADVQPDLVLMDIRMPGKMDGVDAALKIKKMCDIPVVFVSAFADKETLDRAKIAEPVGFIIKPFIELELQKTVEIALYGHAMEMKLRQSEAKYRALVETTDTGFLILDRQGMVLDANREYVRLTGHRELREILGRCVTEWTAADAKQKNAEAVARCVRDGKIRNFVTEYVDKIGRITPIEINATVEGKGESLRIVSLCRDITERKRAEADLRESHALYTGLVENIPNSIARIGLDGKFTFVNRQLSKWSGIPAEKFVGSGPEMFAPLLSPSEFKVMAGAVGETIASQEQRECELLFTRPDGSKLQVLQVSYPWRDVNGKMLGVEVLGYDITARKQAEEELLANKEKYRMLVENVNDVVFSVNARGVITFINPVVEQLTGYKPEELVGQPFARFIYPPDLPMLMEQFRVVMAGTIVPDEYRLVTKTGEIRWVRSSSRPIIENGEAAGIQGVAQDITARKHADEALRMSEARFSTVFRSSPVAIAISRSNDNRLIDVNPAWQKLTGYTRAEAIGKTTMELGVVEAGARARLVGMLREHGTLHGREFAFKKKSGEIAHTLLSGEAIRVGDEDCLLTMALDVTERDQAVEASRRSDAELRAMVAKLQLVREESRRDMPPGSKD
jgi:PAS domain S-box-containing protein